MEEVRPPRLSLFCPTPLVVWRFSESRAKADVLETVIPDDQGRSPGVADFRFGTEWSEVQILSPRPILSLSGEHPACSLAGRLASSADEMEHETVDWIGKLL